MGRERRHARLLGSACGAAGLAALLALAIHDPDTPGDRAPPAPRPTVGAHAPPPPAHAARAGGVPRAPQSRPTPLAASRDARDPGAAAGLAHEDAARRAERAAADRSSEAPRSEAEHHARYLALARERGLEALDAAAFAALDGPAPRAQQVAALRAARALDTPGAARLWARALALSGSPSDPHGQALPSFVLGRLSARAARDADARELLHGLVVDRHAATDARLARRAAACLARVGDARELGRLADALRGCEDALLLQGVTAALEENPAARSAAPAFDALPAASRSSGP